MGGVPSVPSPPPEKSQYSYEGDELVSSREVQGDKVITKQIPKAEEVRNKERREADLIALERMIKDFVPTLNTVDPNLQEEIDQQASLMTSQAQENLNRSYQDSIQQLRAMAAGRFGSLQNTFYDNQSNDLNRQFAEQQASIARDIEGRKSELRQQELGNRQNYYSTLQNQAQNLRQGINDFRDLQAQRYNQQLQGSQLSNNFDANNYGTYMSGWNTAQQIGAQRNPFNMLFSDAALKDNIKTTDSVLDKLDDIGVYDYNYMFDPNRRTTGLVAQEVEEVFPDAVVTHPNGYKMIDQQTLIPVLFQAVKELKQRLGG